jgi:hypothetical protein
MAIVIYTNKVTNRIKYTLDFVFTEYFGIEYVLTESIDFTICSEHFYINYSDKKIPDTFSIFQDKLLLQEDIQQQKLFISFEKELPVFFQTTNHYDIQFDIFSCIFFLLSRYEEYLPHEKDVHGRYVSSNSILANSVFNFSPIVEYWLDFFKNEILKSHPILLFKKYEFEYVPTFDIDNAFHFLGRNWFKNPPNIFKNECRNVLLNKEKDAYNTFDFILDELHKTNQKAIFFFLMNDDGKENSNVAPKSKLLKENVVLIASQNFDIGIHPSYFAEEKKLFQQEKDTLEIIKHSEITISRQHFLRINFPNYFRELVKFNIQKDYSLGYPNISGFRAGCSRPFYFFDVEKNETTSLLLQPSCFMDATFEYYYPKNEAGILQDFLTIFNQLKKINGILVPIFHNDLLAKEKFRNIFKLINQHAS